MGWRSRIRRGIAIAGELAATLALAHLAGYRLWRRRCVGWGADDREVGARLAGDDLLAAPVVVTTRAVSIDAPVEDVWPWLVQIGPGRGGAYTYDSVENLLGLNMHSADTVVPEWQRISIGDCWQLGSAGPIMRVASIDRQRSLVFRSDDGNWVWAFVLIPDPPGTRLLSRNRIAVPGSSRLLRAWTMYAMEPASLVMERKMLLGIRQRAERLAGSRH